ncbi:MAG: hypothetical protein E3K32_12450 [wastewater metagenome]|nr:hypothetical protein [Candidatus Loosdrechtia aerotolerans]
MNPEENTLLKKKRRDLIKAIEEKRNSKLIVFLTSDRPNLGFSITTDVVPILHKHILAIEDAKRSKIDLLLYSRGGHSDVPWTIVSMFREYFNGSFCVLLPYKAHSAATLIAIGADEIVMTKKAELGPIDITINNGPYNQRDEKTGDRLPISVEDVTGYFDLFNKMGCERPEEKLRGLEQLTERVHPMALGMVSRILEQTELIALRLLGTRVKPFTEEKNKEIVRRISEIYSHSHTISRTEAIQQLGLKQIVKAEDIGISEELWSLYEEYNTLFQLNKPFMPEEYLVTNNLDENTWHNLYLACVESISRFDTYQKSLRVRRLKQSQPQVTLNISNIAFPAINIPQLPPDVTSEQIRKIVEKIVSAQFQSIVNNAVKVAVNEFLKALPSAGFEHISFKSSWIEED